MEGPAAKMLLQKSRSQAIRHLRVAAVGNIEEKIGEMLSNIICRKVLKFGLWLRRDKKYI